jgi:hypothetical protein
MYIRSILSFYIRLGKKYRKSKYIKHLKPKLIKIMFKDLDLNSKKTTRLHYKDRLVNAV